MKISLAWLNNYLDRSVEADQVEQVLTDQGLPIESRLEVGGDVMLDVEVTSNRSDCLSHIGLAREMAAGAGCALVEPDYTVSAASGGNTTNEFGGVRVEDAKRCSQYTARVIRGVKVGPSPAWLVQRLEAVGQRSVNNVADVTNFVLLELGQPLHAFDLAQLAGGRIVVRQARRGEAFVAIDGSRHELTSGMLVIADDREPVAVAGIMGGFGSRVTQKTVDVVLESAAFDPSSVRCTGRALKLSSESSFRFERGVDPMGVQRASARAANLICEVAGGHVAGELIQVGGDAPQARQVTMRTRQCNELLGLRLTPAVIAELLERLGFEPRAEGDGERVVCTVPSYRLDVSREVDLIEEVARAHGLEAVPVQEKIHIVTRPVQPRVAARQSLGRVLVAHGYHETVTFSFLNEKHGRAFLTADEQVVSVDEQSRHVGTRAEPVLRPSVLPSLLACRKANQGAGNTDVRLYECAAVWSRREGKVIERNHLALLCDAHEAQQTLRDVRGTVSELVERLAGNVGLSFVPAELNGLTGAALIEISGQRLGRIGLIDEGRQRLFDLQVSVVIAELDLDALLDAYPPTRRVGGLPRFPAIERDLSVVVDERVRWGDIQGHVLATEPALLEDVAFLDVYRGKPIPKSKKSVSFRMLFRDPVSTLRHEQVDPQVAAVVQRLEIQVDAQLRG